MPYKNSRTKQAKQRAYSSAYYEKNKALVQAATRESAKKYRDQWRSFKATLACVKCGQRHPATFDFHHVDSRNKESSINDLVRNRAFKKAMEEIKKCIVLCANCHRIHHYEERAHRRAKKKKGNSAP